MNVTFPRIPLRSLIGAAALWSGAVALSAAQTGAINLHFDPARTQIRYTAGGPLRRVHGSFHLKAGELAFDPATGVAQGQILVDAASGRSGDPKLDARMQSEVIESQKYPEIFFHAEKSSGTVKPDKSEHLTLIGSINIHGADHPLKVDALVTLHGDQASATTEFDVPYVDWGMKEASTWLLHARVVHIAIDAHATVEGASGSKQ